MSELAVNAETLVDQCYQLKSLPQVFEKLQSVISSPDHTSADVDAVLSTDPALSARLLKIVNSAYYGIPRQIGDILSAIIILGEDDLRNMVVATSLAQTLDQCSGLDIKKFWRRSLLTGLIARAIGKQQKHKYSERLFVAGLLADVGQLILYQDKPELHEKVVSHSCEFDQELHTTECELIGFCHADVGTVLTRQWQFPEMISEAIESHHHPISFDSDFETHVEIIALADHISGCIVEDIDENLLPELSHQVLNEALDQLVLDAIEQRNTLYELFFG